MHTKVLDGSSVNDCLRPRRATGCCPPDGVSGSSTGGSSLELVALSTASCCAGLRWFVESAAVDWAGSREAAVANGSLVCEDLRTFFGGVLFLGFILMDASSDVRRESGGVINPTGERWSESSMSSRLSSLRNSSSPKETSMRCRLLPRNTAVSQGEKRARFAIGSCSESKSEKVSNADRPPRVAVAAVAYDCEKWESGLTKAELGLGRNLCSSPEQKVGKADNSPAGEAKLLVPTIKLRGSQKSKSVVEVVERGIGDGDGEREGQESMERRSEAWLAVTEGG